MTGVQTCALPIYFLDTLSDENFVIFLRRYWFSDTYAEISERTGIPEKSISMRLVRIRKQMKQYLIEREVYVGLAEKST